jgi:hypothetical protein
MRKHPGALGCGSAGRVDRYGNGSEPISEQATEVAGNIGTEQRKPKRSARHWYDWRA